jgi:hypothetical protein
MMPRIKFWERLCLDSIPIYVLTSIALMVQKCNSYEWNAGISGGFDMISSKNAQSARIRVKV